MICSSSTIGAVHSTYLFASHSQALTFLVQAFNVEGVYFYFYFYVIPGEVRIRRAHFLCESKGVRKWEYYVSALNLFKHTFYSFHDGQARHYRRSRSGVHLLVCQFPSTGCMQNPSIYFFYDTNARSFATVSRHFHEFCALRIYKNVPWVWRELKHDFVPES